MNVTNLSSIVRHGKFLNSNKYLVMNALVFINGRLLERDAVAKTLQASGIYIDL